MYNLTACSHAKEKAVIFLRVLTLQNEAELERQLSHNHHLMLIHFYARKCLPCTMMLPTIEEIAAEHQQKLTVLQMEIGKFPSLAEKYQITHTPTLLLFQNQRQILHSVGSQSKTQLRQWLSPYIF